MLLHDHCIAICHALWSIGWQLMRIGFQLFGYAQIIKVEFPGWLVLNNFLWIYWYSIDILPHYHWRLSCTVVKKVVVMYIWFVIIFFAQFMVYCTLQIQTQVSEMIEGVSLPTLCKTLQKKLKDLKLMLLQSKVCFCCWQVTFWEVIMGSSLQPKPKMK